MSNCVNKALLTFETKCFLNFESLGFEVKLQNRCGAFARSTGQPCRAKGLANGRCKNHGGMSTGPKTPEGRQAISQATRKRMASGGRIRVLAGFYRWLEDGGALTLSRLAKTREFKKRLQRLQDHLPNASRTGA